MEQQQQQETNFENQCIYYENEVTQRPKDHDLWFAYIKLLKRDEKKEGRKIHEAKMRDVYDRAMANVPVNGNEQQWSSYVRLSVSYADYEEHGGARDVQRARNVYYHCLGEIPNKDRFFIRLWTQVADFEIRHDNLEAARNILDTALCNLRGSDEILFKCINMEMPLRNVDRCREIFRKYVNFNKEDCIAWIRFAQFEAYHSYKDGTRGVDTEEKMRQGIERARKVVERAIDYITRSHTEFPIHNQDELTLLDFWRSMEANFGDMGDVKRVNRRMKNLRLHLF